LGVADAVFDDVVCSLESIPTKITVLNELFILRGAAVFIGNRRTARTGIWVIM